MKAGSRLKPETKTSIYSSSPLDVTFMDTPTHQDTGAASCFRQKHVNSLTFVWVNKVRIELAVTDSDNKLQLVNFLLQRIKKRRESQRKEEECVIVGGGGLCLITAPLFVNDSINGLFDWPDTSARLPPTRRQRNELNRQILFTHKSARWLFQRRPPSEKIHNLVNLSKGLKKIKIAPCHLAAAQTFFFPARHDVIKVEK